MKAAGAVIAVCATAWPIAAAAQTRGVDGAYGRLDGDLGIQVDFGGAAAGSKTAVASTMCARYMQTAGICVGWLDDFRSEVSGASRSVTAGLELRPLFLPRFSRDLERGPARWDLLLDSWSLRMSAVTSRSHAYSLESPGLELGTTIGIPLLERVQGPWLTASVALRVATRTTREDNGAVIDRVPVFALTFGWQTISNSGIAAMERSP